LSLTEDQLTVVKATLKEVSDFVEGGRFRKLAGEEQSIANVSSGLKKVEDIIKGEYAVTDEDVKNAKKTLNIRGGGAPQNMRKSIEDSLSTPFDVELNPKTEKLRETIEGELASPFNIDIVPEPKNNLHDAIDALINSDKYRIDLELGISGVSGGKNNPY